MHRVNPVGHSGKRLEDWSAFLVSFDLSLIAVVIHAQGSTALMCGMQGGADLNCEWRFRNVRPTCKIALCLTVYITWELFYHLYSSALFICSLYGYAA